MIYVLATLLGILIMAFIIVIIVIDKPKLGGVLAALLFSMIALMSVSAHITMKEAYKQGQIDALNGKIKYEMKVVPDSTWVKINEL